MDLILGVIDQAADEVQKYGEKLDNEALVILLTLCDRILGPSLDPSVSLRAEGSRNPCIVLPYRIAI